MQLDATKLAMLEDALTHATMKKRVNEFVVREQGRICLTDPNQEIMLEVLPYDIELPGVMGFSNVKEFLSVLASKSKIGADITIKDGVLMIDSEGVTISYQLADPACIKRELVKVEEVFGSLLSLTPQASFTVKNPVKEMKIPKGIGAEEATFSINAEGIVYVTFSSKSGHSVKIELDTADGMVEDDLTISANALQSVIDEEETTFILLPEYLYLSTSKYRAIISRLGA